MSRKTVRFARAAAAFRRTHADSKDLTPLLPDSAAAVRGNGTTRQKQDNAGKRGEGAICSRPMSPQKAARLLASVK